MEKSDGVESNPYLDNPDITATDGRIFTKKNPALMTREISEIALEKGLFQFHITSLNPINPSNIPDEKEKEALESFESGEIEVIWQEIHGESIYYRYMAPLMVTESCLSCHAKQGYVTGDVRGGISVKFDVSEVQSAVKRDFRIILGGCIISAAIFLCSIYYMIHRLIRAVSIAHSRIKAMAITDDLTELTNRRHFFELANLEFARAKRYGYHIGCMMIDLDHFKSVNDTYGHQIGDVLLNQVSKLLSTKVRENDIPARYGGEEFICPLAHTDLHGCEVVSERVRTAIETLAIPLGNNRILKVTVSIGVALKTDDINLDQLIKYADEALYIAKNNGRNRVEFYHKTS